jgi:uncharacterized protein YecA (UPF0149 family)
VRRTNWAQNYFDIWGKPPGVPLTSEEFAKREPIWNAEVFKQQEIAKRRELEELRKKLERQKHWEERERQGPVPFPVAPSPAVGRNQPCSCGSGRKFKKCCGP